MNVAFIFFWIPRVKLPFPTPNYCYNFPQLFSPDKRGKVATVKHCTSENASFQDLNLALGESRQWWILTTVGSAKALSLFHFSCMIVWFHSTWHGFPPRGGSAVGRSAKALSLFHTFTFTGPLDRYCVSSCMIKFYLAWHGFPPQWGSAGRGSAKALANPQLFVSAAPAPRLINYLWLKKIHFFAYMKRRNACLLL